MLRCSCLPPFLVFPSHFFLQLSLKTRWYPSLLQSNIGILESDCEVAQLLLDAAKARRDHLYLGLDISTQSTGYTVLRPSATAPVGVASGGSLQGVGEAKLMEWGCIVGSGSGSKKRDVVDVGMVVEKRLKEVAARCSADADVDASPGVASGGSDDNAKSSPGVAIGQRLGALSGMWRNEVRYE